jgi:hypothetical protein
MARRQKRAAQPPRLDEPTRWRLQHGAVSAPQRIADPETGTPVAVRRAIDTLGQMLANATITPEMHEAGCIFRTQFRLAALDPLRARSLLRLPGSTGDSVTEQQAAARQRVARALAALGGAGSPAGSCVSHVVGCETSVREWAMRQGWGGRPIPASQAQGVLVAALAVLAAHYGLMRRVERLAGSTCRAASIRTCQS